MDQAVMLTWHQFSSNLAKAADLMKEKHYFTDVTLAAEDRQIEAHRFMLASSSSFFLNLLYKNPVSNPLIFLYGIKFRNLVSILDFIYCGQVQVEQSRLQEFLTVAENLGIKGLCEESKDDTGRTEVLSKATNVRTDEDMNTSRESEARHETSIGLDDETEEPLLEAHELMSEAGGDEDLTTCNNVESKGVVKIVVADKDSVEVDDYVEDGLEEEFHNPDDFVQEASPGVQDDEISADIGEQHVSRKRSRDHFMVEIATDSLKRSPDFTTEDTNIENITDATDSEALFTDYPDNNQEEHQEPLVLQLSPAVSPPVSPVRKRVRSGPVAGSRSRTVTRGLMKEKPMSRTSPRKTRKPANQAEPKRRRLSLNPTVHNRDKSSNKPTTIYAIKQKTISVIKQATPSTSNQKTDTSIKHKTTPKTKIIPPSNKGTKSKQSENKTATPVHDVLNQEEGGEAAGSEGKENENVRSELELNEDWKELMKNERVAGLMSLMLTQKKGLELGWSCSVCPAKFRLKRDAGLHLYKQHIKGKLDTKPET